MPRVSTLLTAVLVTGAVAAMYWPRQPAEVAAAPDRPQAPTGVVVTLASARTFTDRIEALATTLANESVTISADAAGRIERIHFADGDTVKSGQLLVTLDSDKEQAQVNAARVNLETQRTQYRRLLDLVNRKSAAPTDLDAQTNAVKQAEADMEVARVNLADRRIVAPFAGKLGIRRVSQGALVNRDTEIVTLDDLDTVKLAFSVPEISFESVRVGLDVQAHSAAYPGQPMRGEVTAIGSRVDPVTRTFEVRAMLPNKQALLRPGMLMTVELLLPPRESLAVPEESLLAQDQRHFVLRVGADDKVQRVRVEIGARRPGVAEIRSGLSPGDRVVVEGITRVRPGATVKVVDTRGVAAAADQTPATSRTVRGG